MKLASFFSGLNNKIEQEAKARYIDDYEKSFYYLNSDSSPSTQSKKSCDTTIQSNSERYKDSILNSVTETTSQCDSSKSNVSHLIKSDSSKILPLNSLAQDLNVVTSESEINSILQSSSETGIASNRSGGIVCKDGKALWIMPKKMYRNTSYAGQTKSAANKHTFSTIHNARCTNSTLNNRMNYCSDLNNLKGVNSPSNLSFIKEHRYTLNIGAVNKSTSGIPTDSLQKTAAVTSKVNASASATHNGIIKISRTERAISEQDNYNKKLQPSRLKYGSVRNQKYNDTFKHGRVNFVKLSASHKSNMDSPYKSQSNTTRSFDGDIKKNVMRYIDDIPLSNVDSSEMNTDDSHLELMAIQKHLFKTQNFPQYELNKKTSSKSLCSCTRNAEVLHPKPIQLPISTANQKSLEHSSSIEPVVEAHDAIPNKKFDNENKNNTNKKQLPDKKILLKQSETGNHELNAFKSSRESHKKDYRRRKLNGDKLFILQVIKKNHLAAKQACDVSKAAENDKINQDKILKKQNEMLSSHLQSIRSMLSSKISSVKSNSAKQNQALTKNSNQNSLNTVQPNELSLSHWNFLLHQLAKQNSETTVLSMTAPNSLIAKYPERKQQKKSFSTLALPIQDRLDSLSRNAFYTQFGSLYLDKAVSPQANCDKIQNARNKLRKLNALIVDQKMQNQRLKQLIKNRQKNLLILSNNSFDLDLVCNRATAIGKMICEEDDRIATIKRDINNNRELRKRIQNYIDPSS